MYKPMDNHRVIPNRDVPEIGEAYSYQSPMHPRTDQLFTWEHAVRALRKNMYVIVILAGCLTAGIAIFAFLLRDTYQPTARLEIDPPGTGLKTLAGAGYPDAADNQDYLETQVQILQSDTLAMSVIRALKLDRAPEFVGGSETADLGRPQETTSESAAPVTNEKSFEQEQADLAERTPLESKALTGFRKRLLVTSVRNTRLVELTFASHDPGLAQAVTNALVTQFIDQNHKSRYATTMAASEWLSSQLNDLQHKVEESNQAVADYQKRYGLVEVDDKDVPQGQLMSDVSQKLSDAQANRIEDEAYVRMLDVGQSEAIPALRDDQLYQNLMEHYADARGKLAEARAIYGDENFNVKKLEDESSELAAQAEAERTRVAERVRVSFAAARAREDMLTHERQSLRAQMGDASSHLVEYRVLRDEALTN